MTPDETLELSIGGELLRFGRPGLGLLLHAADRLREIRNRRFEEEVVRCGSLQGEQLHAALTLAFEKHQTIITDREITNWLETPEGTVFILWRALRKHRPDCREEQAHAIYASLRVEQLELLSRFLASTPSEVHSPIVLSHVESTGTVS